MNDEYEERDKQRGVNNDFFSEADCDLAGRDAMYFKAISLEKANALLREHGRIVQSRCQGEWITSWPEDQFGNSGNTHTALLINVQAIEPADSAEQILKELFEASVKDDDGKYICISRNLIDRTRKILAREK